MEDKERQRKHSLQILSKMKNIDRPIRPRTASLNQTEKKEKKHNDSSDSEAEETKGGGGSDSEPEISNKEPSTDILFQYIRGDTVIDINEQIKADMIGEILNEFSNSPYLLKEEMKEFVSRYQEKQFADFISAIDSLKDEILDMQYDFKNEKKDLKKQLSESQRKYDEDMTHLKIKHESEITEWKTKQDELMTMHENERIMFKQELEDKIKNRVEDKVKNRLKYVEKCILDQVQLQSQIKVLENDKEVLEERLDEETKRYDEVLVTLQEVQSAYGDMRDVVLEKYKQQVTEMQERVRIAEESNNENTITELRQQVLDARLLLERVRQSHEDEFTKYKIREQEYKETIRNHERDINALKNDNSKLRNSILDLKSHADISSQMNEEKSEKIENLVKEATSAEDIINDCKTAIHDKNEEILECKQQIVSLNEAINEVNSQKTQLEKEMEIIHTLREEINKSNEYTEELKNQVKLKSVKVKYLKKQVKELLEQKKKSESLVAILPDMHKQIDALQADKSSLEKSIQDRAQKDIEEKDRIQREKREEEERKRKSKEDWERRILGIGDCELYHEGAASEFSVKSEDFSRPGSAPLAKLRTASLKRNTSSSKKYLDSTLPTYLSREARRIHDKRHQRSESTRTLKKNNFFNALTMPANHLNSLKKEDLPLLSRTNSPRVLVLDNKTSNGVKTKGGSSLLAIGDRVSANILRQCDSHGTSTHEHSGVVKFIGFINGNHKDVYIGIRLDEEVGNTDGYIDGKRYFRCEPNRGKFVRYEDITKVIESKAAHVPVI